MKFAEHPISRVNYVDLDNICFLWPDIPVSCLSMTHWKCYDIVDSTNHIPHSSFNEHAIILGSLLDSECLEF